MSEEGPSPLLLPLFLSVLPCVPGLPHFLSDLFCLPFLCLTLFQVPSPLSSHNKLPFILALWHGVISQGGTFAWARQVLSYFCCFIFHNKEEVPFKDTKWSASRNQAPLPVSHLPIMSFCYVSISILADGIRALKA